MSGNSLRRLIPRPESSTARRARTLRRTLDYAARRPTRSGAVCIPFYWWDGFKNFGDALTPWLLQKYGIAPILTTGAYAEAVGVGSILEQLPPSFSGVTWGTGSLYGEPLDLPHLRPLALRGHFTRELLKAPADVYLGEPGLLVAEHMRPPRKRYALGIVPHHAHEQNPHVLALSAAAGATGRLISTKTHPARAIRQIAECDVIVSSSLHGLVTADAFGIPALWFTAEPDLWGGTFKFHDYESVVTPGRTRQRAIDEVTSVTVARSQSGRPDAAVLARVTRDLEESIGALHRLFTGWPTTPTGLIPLVGGRRR